MMKIKIIAAASLVAFLPACSGGWAGDSYAPVVDVHGSSGKDPNMYAGELNLCQQLAASRPQVEDTLKGAGVGALAGAGAGAIGGAMKGGRALKGSGYGAAIGALAGGGYTAYRANENRQNVVMECMRNRGWSVLAR